MPLDEEGAKWSCEPCIRGHRSSKCQHFDRLMMKVPKAGRPLAKCPHPKGACSCQKTYAFMVRIPKGSTCLCRPLYKVPASTDDSSQSTPAPVAPASSSTPGKVQKSGRRQSHAQAASGNLAKALEAMPDNLKFEEGMVNYAATVPRHSEQNDPHSAMTPSNGFPPAPAPVPDEPTTNGSSCCSKKLQPQPVASNAGGSCCSGRPNEPQAPDTPFNGNGFKASHPSGWNDMSYMNYSAPQMPAWQSPMASTQSQFMQSLGMHSAQPQPLYMDNYAPNVSSAPSYSNTMNGLGTMQTAVAQFASDHFQRSAHSHTHLDADSCHDCKCGDDCQCLGCAAHPFNNTTRQHVQEMGVMMTFDGDEQHTPETITNAYQSSPFQGTTPSTPLNFGFMQHNPSMGSTAQQDSFDPYSDPNSTMPSGYSSPLRVSHHLNQQLMHPSEYYTLEYPVGIPSTCSNVTGSCQCGNDCSCVGCLTHSGHNGVPLEASVPEPSLANAEEQQSLSHRHTPVASISNRTSHIPVLDSISVPCLSPRTLETSMI